MANHFTDLGFNISEPDDLTELLVQAAEQADKFPLETGGELLRWGIGAGIELWVQVDTLGELVGVHPFFLGPTRIPFKVTRVDVNSNHPQDGSLMGWVRPDSPEDEDSSGAYPMRFDLPSFPRDTEEILNCASCELQVAAFADELRLFKTEEEFFAAQDSEPLFAVQSFVPIGLFEADEDDETWEDDAEEFGDPHGARLLEEREDEGQSVAEALFSGYVRRCEKRVNPYTQNPFWWIQVETYHAEYDVVTDPELLDGEPEPGDILQGQFWMAARITDVTR